MDEEICSLFDFLECFNTETLVRISYSLCLLSIGSCSEACLIYYTMKFHSRRHREEGKNESYIKQITSY